MHAVVCVPTVIGVQDDLKPASFHGSIFVIRRFLLLQLIATISKKRKPSLIAQDLQMLSDFRSYVPISWESPL